MTIETLPSAQWTETDPAAARPASAFVVSPDAPGQVTGVSLTIVSATQINIAWGAVVRASLYRVQRLNSGVWGTIGTTAGLTLSDTGLTSGTLYQYRVRAENAGGEGPWSTTEGVTTPPTTTDVWVENDLIYTTTHADGFAFTNKLSERVGYLVPFTAGGVAGYAWDNTATAGVELRFQNGGVVTIESAAVAPFSPGTVSDLALWLRADTTTHADGELVGHWSDQSGNRRDAVQLTFANQPVYRTNRLGGKPALVFDGVEDWMHTPAMPLGAFTIFLVARVSTGLMLMEHGPNANQSPGHWLLGTNNHAMNVNRGGVASKKDLPVNWAVHANPRIIRHRYGGTHPTHQLALNGAVQLTSNEVTADPGSGVHTAELFIACRSGVALHTRMDLAEVLIYGRDLTATEVGNIETHLAGKYGITLGV